MELHNRINNRVDTSSQTEVVTPVAHPSSFPHQFVPPPHTEVTINPAIKVVGGVEPLVGVVVLAITVIAAGPIGVGDRQSNHGIQ